MLLLNIENEFCKNWFLVRLSKLLLFRALLAMISLTQHVLGQDGGLEFTQPEEQAVGHFVGSASTYWNLLNMVGKDDMAFLRFSILSDDSGRSSFFAVDTTTGSISFSKRVDRESVCPRNNFCELNIRVAVSGPNSFFSTIPVRVNITDINDNSPVFPAPGFFEIHISEAASENLSSVIPAASDADSSPEFGVKSYALEPVSEAFDVVVVRNFVGTPHVSLVLRQKLDREKVSSYTLYVVAKDGGAPPMSSTLTVKIIVDDVNDNDPKFTEKVYTANFSEEAGSGFQVTMVTATDEDIGNNGKVVYELNSVLSTNSGDVKDRITIDNITGAISLKKTMASGDYRFLIDARDLGNPPRSDQAVVSVTVLDTINNQPIIRLNPVQIDNLPFGWVSEGSGVSTVVAVLSVGDNDSGRNGSVTCMSLVENFHLQPLEAKRYKVTIVQQLDREANATAAIRVICKDHGSPSLNATAALTLNVFDINDNSPVFEQPTYSQTIPENNLKDSVILAVTATDKDDGQNGEIEYKLINNEDNFRINPESGIITTNIKFDREDRDRYVVLVVAVDRGDPSMSSTATVVVKVSDVNDVRPIFGQEVYKFQMYENKEAGSIVGNLTVNDPDLGPGGSVILTLKSVNESDVNPFQLNQDGRMLSLVSFDREEKSFYEFDVIASDQGTPKLSSKARVSIEILDVNDVRPSFIFPSDHNFTALVNIPVKQDTVILQVTVQDFDEKYNSYVTFSIAATNATDFLRIGLFTGEVIPNRDLEKSDVGIYYITINVTDQGVPTLWNARTLYLMIQSDQNSNDLLNLNVLIVSCIVCVTVLVSGAVLVVICFVSRHDHRKHFPRVSLFQQQKADKESEDVVEDNKRRIKLSWNARESSPKRNEIVYHQQHHINTHNHDDITTNNTVTERSVGQPLTINCRVIVPEKGALVISPSIQGRQVTDLKTQKLEDFLSTTSAETCTGDSGHGSDEEASSSVEHSSIAASVIPETNRSKDASVMWSHHRQHLDTSSSSSSAKHQQHFGHSQSKTTHGSKNSTPQSNCFKFNLHAGGMKMYRHPPIDELSVCNTNSAPTRSFVSSFMPRSNNININNTAARNNTSTHAGINTSLPQSTNLPPRLPTEPTIIAQTARRNVDKTISPPHKTISPPTQGSSSTTPMMQSKGQSPHYPYPPRQISFVSQSSNAEDDYSDDSDVNTTTSGSYSVISEDIGRQGSSRPYIKDMYV